MLQTLFQNTVSALCYEIASEQLHGEPEQGLGSPYNDITRFVIDQYGSMPQVLGAGVRLATILFALSGGSLFHRLEPPRRHVRVAAWTVSPLGPCRDLIRLYSSLVILALYSRPGVLSRLPLAYARDSDQSHDREGVVSGNGPHLGQCE